jgi:cytochrome b6-f complex subunit 7
MQLIRKLLNRRALPPSQSMASEIFGTAALFWVLIPVGLLGGALLLKFADED